MKLEDLKIEITPSRGFVLSRKINGEWELYYTISGPTQNCCKKCGYPLDLHEDCKHHEGLKELDIEYSLDFAGYYQTDFNGNPLNKLTERI
ncbi:MAG: hypothetical protein ACTSPQ_22195, partial [Candidatus Helarchaeota archaeon]